MADRATQLGIAQVPIRGDLAPLDKDLDKARSKLDKTLSKLASDMNKKLASLGKAAVLGGIGALTAALGGVTVALGGALRLASDTAPLTESARAFTALSGGAEQAERNLRAAQEAAQGTLTRFEAMAVSNKLLSMRLAESDQGLHDIIESAYVLRRAMDPTVGATAAVEDFALMLANQSIMRMDQFGLSSGRARARIEELMATTAGMTREAAFLQAVMEQAGPKVEALLGQGDDLATRAKRISAGFRQMREDLGERLAPLLDAVISTAERGLPVLNRFATGVSKLFLPVAAGIKTAGPLIADELSRIIDNVAPYGEGISASIARGIADGIPYILAAIRVIGNIITYWLEPGSPPRLLPDLDKWGTSAMNEWFRGWTKGDFGILRSISGTLGNMLRGMVSQGVIGEGEANPILRALRGSLAAALDELRATGTVSEATFAGIRSAGGAAGAQAEAYARKALGVEQAKLKVKALEGKLAKATSAEEVSALAEQLDAARREQKAAEQALELEQERLQTLIDEAGLLERQAELMEKIAASTEKAAGSLIDALASVESLLGEMPALTAGENPFAAMFDTEAIQAKVDEIVNKIMPALFGPDGESGILPKLKRFLEGDFKYAVIGAFAVATIAIVAWAVTSLVAMGPVGWVILGIGLAVAILAKAWDENWLGMRTALQEAWKVMEPILDKIIAKYNEALSVVDRLMAKQMEAAAAQGAPYGAGYGLSPGVMPGQGMPSIGGQASGMEPTWFRSPTHMIVGEGGEPELVSVIPKSKLGSSGGGTVYYQQTINVQDRAYAALLSLERDRYLRTVERGL